MLVRLHTLASSNIRIRIGTVTLERGFVDFAGVYSFDEIDFHPFLCYIDV